MHIVVVNTLTGSPFEFTVEVDTPFNGDTFGGGSGGFDGGGGGGDGGVGMFSGSVGNATRLFESSYNVTLGLNGTKMVLHDWIGVSCCGACLRAQHCVYYCALYCCIT
jgi:hypothetical protein